jgi:hypothetical protein
MVSSEKRVSWSESRPPAFALSCPMVVWRPQVRTVRGGLLAQRDARGGDLSRPTKTGGARSTLPRLNPPGCRSGDRTAR